MAIGVYVLKHLATGNFYIGSTADFTRRKAQHLSSLRKGNHANVKLQSSYLASPEVDWEFTPTSSYEEALVLEHSMIRSNWGNTLLCNEVHYDEKGNTVVSDAFKIRMSRAKKGVPQSELNKAALSIARTGRKQTPEWVEKRAETTRIKVEVDGVVYNSATEAAVAHGCTVMTVMNRVRNPKAKWAGWKTSI